MAAALREKSVSGDNNHWPFVEHARVFLAEYYVGLRVSDGLFALRWATRDDCVNPKLTDNAVAKEGMHEAKSNQHWSDVDGRSSRYPRIRPRWRCDNRSGNQLDVDLCEF